MGFCIADINTVLLEGDYIFGRGVKENRANSVIVKHLLDIRDLSFFEINCYLMEYIGYVDDNDEGICCLRSILVSI
jgi:hypothetical protein